MSASQYDTHPLVGKIAKRKNNGARVLIEGASDNTVTIQGWVHREVLERADFDEAYEVQS